MENIIQQPQVSFVTTETSFDAIRRKNFFTYGFIASFVWMCFHFTLVYFFGIQLGSPTLVGIFLGLGNIVAFFADSPVGVLQKYFVAKKLFLTSAILMLVVSVIFLYFIFLSSSIEKTLQETGGSIIGSLFGSGINIILLILSVVLYGVIKELTDVTSLSYIMNNADPSEYAELLSKNNIFSGVGALFGLVLSGIILALNTTLSVSILILFISLFIGFIIVYFDNSKSAININFADIKKLRLISPQKTIESVRQYTVQQIQKVDFAQVTSGIKFIFLKPLQIKESINIKEIIEVTKKDLKAFIEVLFIPPYNYKLLLMMVIVILFGFWDTFVVTFLVEFLNKIIQTSDIHTALFTGYVFIAILAIPAFGGQIPLIGLSKRVGKLLVILSGVLLSGISVFLFGFNFGFWLILLFGILNSIGYAAAMPLAQGEFSDSYNQIYAEKWKLQEIDSNASSAPLKMVLNMANVVGLIFGGLLISIGGFNGTFFVLGIVLIGVFGTSLLNKTKWGL